MSDKFYNLYSSINNIDFKTHAGYRGYHKINGIHVQRSFVNFESHIRILTWLQPHAHVTTTDCRFPTWMIMQFSRNEHSYISFGNIQILLWLTFMTIIVLELAFNVEINSAVQNNSDISEIKSKLLRSKPIFLPRSGKTILVILYVHSEFYSNLYFIKRWM